VRKLLPLALVSCALLLAGYVGTAGADPLNNNRLQVPASCKEDGERFTFVINGEGVAGHIIGSTSNIHPVEDTVTYTYTARFTVVGLLDDSRHARNNLGRLGR
jgi:hypothetical protein